MVVWLGLSRFRSKYKYVPQHRYSQSRKYARARYKQCSAIYSNEHRLPYWCRYAHSSDYETGRVSVNAQPRYGTSQAKGGPSNILLERISLPNSHSMDQKDVKLPIFCILFFVSDFIYIFLSICLSDTKNRMQKSVISHIFSCFVCCLACIWR